MVAEILKLTEEKASLGQENRELTRDKIAMQRRLNEAEDKLAEKEAQLQEAQKKLKDTLAEFEGMHTALANYDDKNRKLQTDNKEYVK